MIISFWSSSYQIFVVKPATSIRQTFHDWWEFYQIFSLWGFTQGTCWLTHLRVRQIVREAAKSISYFCTWERNAIRLNTFVDHFEEKWWVCRHIYKWITDDKRWIIKCFLKKWLYCTRKWWFNCLYVFSVSLYVLYLCISFVKSHD